MQEQWSEAETSCWRGKPGEQCKAAREIADKKEQVALINKKMPDFNSAELSVEVFVRGCDDPIQEHEVEMRLAR